MRVFKSMCNRFTVSTSMPFPPSTNSKFESRIGIRSWITMRLSTWCRPSTTYLASKRRAPQQPMCSWLTGAVGAAGVNTLAVNEAIEEAGVATTATEWSRKSATQRRRRGRQAAGQRADVLQLPCQRPLRPRLHREAVQDVSWKRARQRQMSIPGGYEGPPDY